MTLSRFIEWFTAIQLIVICLSHILQPRVWTDLFKDLFSRPYAGLVVGMFTLPFGLLIVLGHNVWVMDVPVIVTIIGFGWTIKGTLYLLVPGVSQRVARRHLDHPERFAIAGAVLGVIGAVVLVHLIVGGAPITQ
ncbi:MAG: hypothetical protein L0Y44_14920 [Phycisphaerales bacterium]|nr:hypothetical protein [Phycisphaerales bacterium]MCI0677398.1 hypothetical protein [Phycisphaerales bacterium]